MEMKRREGNNGRRRRRWRGSSDVKD